MDSLTKLDGERKLDETLAPWVGRRDQGMALDYATADMRVALRQNLVDPPDGVRYLQTEREFGHRHAIAKGTFAKPAANAFRSKRRRPRYLSSVDL